MQLSPQPGRPALSPACAASTRVANGPKEPAASMITEADKKRLLRAQRTAADRRRQAEVPLGKWREGPMGAIGSQLSATLQRFGWEHIFRPGDMSFYDIHAIVDPSGARSLVAMMLSAAIDKIGPNAVGELFAASTKHKRPDLVPLMRALRDAYGFKELKVAVGKANMVGEPKTGSRTLVYVWTQVSVLGELDPWSYSYRPGIQPSDVFAAMDDRKWFFDRRGQPFHKERATLAKYYRDVRREIASNEGKAWSVASLIQIKLGKLARDNRSVPPRSQRWSPSRDSD